MVSCSCWSSIWKSREHVALLGKDVSVRAVRQYFVRTGLGLSNMPLVASRKSGSWHCHLTGPCTRGRGRFKGSD